MERSPDREPERRRIAWDRYEAVVADLDGVVTRTARIHAEAWKRVFDELLEVRERRGEGGFAPFEKETDYPALDGMPRLDGVRVFLRSRGLELGEGGEGDGLEDGTVAGIGSRKNEIYRTLLAEREIPVYDDAVRLLRALRGRGLRLAVVSSSRNCARVVRGAGLEELFDARVDGETLRELGLRGKPEPDLFAEAMRRLGARPERTAALEDAPAGVASASAAGCALVVGVWRDGDGEELRRRGAHVVVRSFEGEGPGAARGEPEETAR